jgi:signal transduction histidine kinase
MEAQKEFVNIAAHELRTPITPIIMMAGMLDRSGSDGKVTMSRDDFDMIIRNAERLERLTQDVLSVARIESDSLELNIESFNLVEKIEKVIHNIKSSQKSETDYPEIRYGAPELIMIEADKSKIFEVLMNLLKNAVKFTPSGIVIIDSKIEGDNAIVSIRDTGTGIDPEIMPRLFTKFATKSEGGTGLGLYISKRIIEAHGGRIWAENNKGGQGATFTLLLPIKSKAHVLGADATSARI